MNVQETMVRGQTQIHLIRKRLCDTIGYDVHASFQL